MRLAPILIAAVLLPLSGCFGSKDGGGGSSSPAPSSGGGNETDGTGTPLDPTAFIQDYPLTVMAGDPINMTWSVDTGADVTMNTTHTAIHWADFPVEDPQSPDDYGNASEILSGPVPGEFNVTFTIDEPATIYARAHAILGEEHVWSDQVSFDVTPSTTSGARKTVTIGNRTTSYLANYDPQSVTISVGDSVVWLNMDGFSHSATSDAGAPAAFNTGTLAADAASDPIVFTVAGTYTYHCQVHPQTMTGALGGTVIVQA